MDEEQIENFVRRTTLRQIEVILATHEHKSMTAAAHALGMTVANVSRATKRFEENTGLRIFNGNERRTGASADAHAILERFRPLLEEIKRLRSELQDSSLKDPAD